MTKDIARRLMTIALLVLLAAAGASFVASPGTPVWALPSPSSVPDPHPTQE